MNPLVGIPDEITGGWQEGDERFEVVTARRPVAESVVAQVAAATPGLTVRRGVGVAGVLTTAGRDGIVHVTGVRTDGRRGIDGRPRRRRRRAPVVAARAGCATRVARPAGDDRGLRLRVLRPPLPLRRRVDPAGVRWAAAAVRFDLDPHAAGRQRHLGGRRRHQLEGRGAARTARTSTRGRRWCASFPLVAHWIDAEPITDVKLMAKIEDRQRTFVVDGTPVATGVVPLADSWACTNPSLGRGISIGLMHAAALRTLLARGSARRSARTRRALERAHQPNGRAAVRRHARVRPSPPGRDRSHDRGTPVRDRRPALAPRARRWRTRS